MIAVLYPIVGLLADVKLPYALIFLGITALIFTFVARIEEAKLA